MKSIILLFLLFCVIVSAKKTRWFELDNYTFEDYVNEFGKKYSAEEYNRRQNIFEANLASIKRHNADPTKTWKNGVNHLTDKSEAEFRSLLGYKPIYDDKVLSEIRKYKVPYVEKDHYDLSQLPKSVDWRTADIITPVKDQGDCGSCWTFGTAETLESYWAKATGQLTDLSEQQILDCTPNPDECGGTGGCQGGTAELAYAQIIKSGGLTTEWLYPYRSYFGSNFTCHLQTPLAKISGYVTLPSNKYEPLMDHIATVGPLSITVEAIHWAHYETGVFNGCNQTNPDLDHAVQLVGYGTDDTTGMDYWLIRNSWSPTWGELGYIRVVRNPSVGCGVDITPSDGTGCKNGPPTQVVCGTCGVWFDTCYPIVSK
eukprot:TRINITY_DN3940_c0_g1_i1.p1 TRINITY_DN3940_c0_g1~~TRINITY_DN3940_c0_g1_i1.p1  ORF type:complete len:371 (-),score=93.62 TRINITY_DN3940_c0_g1_i1:19-1131(-)